MAFDESKRKRAYRSRGPHKEGCLCAVCKKREAPALAPVAPPPTEVRLDSLPSTTKFMLGGQEYRVGQKFESMVVCYNLILNDNATFGGSTKVKPI